MLTVVLLGTFVDFAHSNLFLASAIGRVSKSRKENEFIHIWLLALLVLFVIFVVARLTGMLLSLAVSCARGFVADVGSVELSRNPRALVSVLEKIADYPYELKGKGRVAHWFFTEPSKRDGKKRVSFWKSLWSTQFLQGGELKF